MLRGRDRALKKGSGGHCSAALPIPKALTVFVALKYRNASWQALRIGHLAINPAWGEKLEKKATSIPMCSQA